MQSGEYDGVSASGDATERLIAGGEVGPRRQPMSSYEQIFDDLKLQDWNSVDGEPYGIRMAAAPTCSSTTPTRSPTPRRFVGVMFEGGTAADGAVSVYDSPIYIADAALYLMATQPDLGITNPYALDETQFAAAIDLLEQQEALVGQYWACTPTSKRRSRGRRCSPGRPGRSSSTSPNQWRPIEASSRWKERPAGRTRGWCRSRRRTRTACCC